MSEEEQVRRPHLNLFNPEEVAEQGAEQILESAITDVDDENDSEDVRWLREQRLHHKSKVWYKRPTLPLLLFAVLLFFTSAGVAMSARVVLMLEVVCKHIDEIQKLDTCKDPKVQEVVSSLQSLCIFTVGLVSALISGKVGELSDRFGRKPILVVLGGFNLLSKFASLYVFRTSIPFHKYSFVGVAVLESLGGANVVLLSVASSYVTDIVESHERIVSLGFVVGSLYTGLAVGPLIGSIYIKHTGSTYSVLYLETGLAILFLLIVFFAIHESRSQKFRSRSQSMHLQRKASFASQLSSQSTHPVFNHQAYLWRVIDIVSPLKSLWLPRHPTEGLKPRINVLLLVTIEAILMLSTISIMPPLILYTTFMFNWSSETIGYYVSVIGFSKTFVLYIFTPFFLHFLKKYIKTNPKAVDSVDFIVVLYGAINELISPLMIILATNSPTIFASAVFSSFGAVCLPTLQAAIVKYMPEGQVGEMFGALALVKNLLVMAGPTGFLYIYSKTVNVKPTFVFYAAFLFILLGAFLTFFINTKSPIEDSESRPVSRPVSTRTNSDIGRDSTTSLFGPGTLRRNTYGSVTSLRDPLSQSPREPLLSQSPGRS